VRTPLNAVVNYLEIALEKRLDQETKDVLTESHSASKSLIYVIDDLLNLTGNAYQAPLPMIHVIFDIRDTVHTTLDRFQKHATQKGLSFEISEDDIPQYVCSDLQRFQQALTQLVTNALNHTEKGGVKIHLRARLTAKDYCVIQVSVQDTGIGITERELDRLFQEFEQVPDEDVDSGQVTVSDTKGLSTSKKSAKLGLGLALVARYIKQCGGRVRGASVAGRGSIFSLDIPMQLGKEDELASVSPSVPTSTTPSGLDEDRSENIARRPALSSAAPTSFQKHLDRVRGHSERSPARSDREQGSVLAIRSASPRAVREPRPASSNTEKPAFPNTGKPVVLIADDNSVNLTILKRRLEKMGHQVKTSVDGQDCFDVYQEHWYTVHLILMDISVSTSSPPRRRLLTLKCRCR
jgi:CheY-like chemotaxis protein